MKATRARDLGPQWDSDLWGKAGHPSRLWRDSGRAIYTNLIYNVSGARGIIGSGMLRRRNLGIGAVSGLACDAD